MQHLVRSAQGLLGTNPTEAGRLYREAATIASELGKGEMAKTYLERSQGLKRLGSTNA